MILCSGCFDGIHAGHVAYLEAARQYAKDGEQLTVAVAPDAYIRAHKSREPHWGIADRLRSVAALRMVDAVLVHDDDGVANVIHLQMPRLFIKGSDWRDKLPSAVINMCQDNFCPIVFVDTPGRHTSEVHAVSTQL